MNAVQIAECVGCGCTDDCACEDGCRWLRVDYEVGLGVCSMCPEMVDTWDAGERKPFDAEEIRRARPPESDVPEILLPGDPEWGETLFEMRARRAV